MSFKTSPREVGSMRYSADYVSNSDNDNDSPILAKSFFSPNSKPFHLWRKWRSTLLA